MSIHQPSVIIKFLYNAKFSNLSNKPPSDLIARGYGVLPVFVLSGTINTFHILKDMEGRIGSTLLIQKPLTAELHQAGHATNQSSSFVIV